MSNFLISHLARAIVKTARSQSRDTTAPIKSEQDQWLIALKAIGLGVLFLSIIAGVIGILLVVLFGKGNVV